MLLKQSEQKGQPHTPSCAENTTLFRYFIHAEYKVQYLFAKQ